MIIFRLAEADFRLKIVEEMTARPVPQTESSNARSGKWCRSRRFVFSLVSRYHRHCLSPTLRTCRSYGDCYDNAPSVCANAILACEQLVKHRFSERDAALAIVAFTEGFYNPRRQQMSIGNISPVEFGRPNQAV